MRQSFLIMLFAVIAHTAAAQAIYLFSDDGQYLGCYNCNQYDTDAVCNEYGNYGSSYSTDSIWNEYGNYGSSYSSYSPWNEYSSSGPKMVDGNGNFYGRFSINTYAGFNQSSQLRDIYNRVNGDLQILRNFVCDN